MTAFADTVFCLVAGSACLFGLYWALLADIHSCHYNFKVGWFCTRDWGHDGPCALKPRWWNLIGRWRSR